MTLLSPAVVDDAYFNLAIRHKSENFTLVQLEVKM